MKNTGIRDNSNDDIRLVHQKIFTFESDIIIALLIQKSSTKIKIKAL